jgi:hypothetical protein
MLYAFLAYHVEELIQDLTPAQDEALMTDLLEVGDRLRADGRLGPSVRLGFTSEAVTVRRGKTPLVLDGPFAETKEQLLGFYVMDFPSLDEAVQAAVDLGEANPTAVYEIRPVLTYRPGKAIEQSGD